MQHPTPNVMAFLRLDVEPYPSHGADQSQTSGYIQASGFWWKLGGRERGRMELFASGQPQGIYRWKNQPVATTSTFQPSTPPQLSSVHKITVGSRGERGAPARGRVGGTGSPGNEARKAAPRELVGEEECREQCTRPTEATKHKSSVVCSHVQNTYSSCSINRKKYKGKKMYRTDQYPGISVLSILSRDRQQTGCLTAGKGVNYNEGLAEQCSVFPGRAQ